MAGRHFYYRHNQYKQGQGAEQAAENILSKTSTLMKLAIPVKARREEEKLIQELDLRAMKSNTTYTTRQISTLTKFALIGCVCAHTVGATAKLDQHSIEGC